jgi:prepilin-type N-terminal cleavage/methylation domain-containing protein
MKTTGFTLLELLVVLAIIGGLAGVGYTVSKTLTNRARILESSTNLRSLVIANQSYESDFGRYCPADDQSNNRRWHGARTSGGSDFDPRNGFLAPYLGRSQRVNTCPLFKAMVSNADSFESGTGGYGYNAAYIGGRPGGSYDRSSKLRIAETMSNIPDPAGTVMFATTAYARSSGLQEYPYCEPPFWDFGSGASGQRPSPSVHFRANGKALVAWCDGHISEEPNNKQASHGENPHGGDSRELDLGWFGREQNNGWWNPRK